MAFQKRSEACTRSMVPVRKGTGSPSKPDKDSYKLRTVVLKADVIVGDEIVAEAGEYQFYYTDCPDGDVDWYAAHVLAYFVGDSCSYVKPSKKADEAKLAAQAAEIEALKAQLAALKAS